MNNQFLFLASYSRRKGPRYQLRGRRLGARGGEYRVEHRNLRPPGIEDVLHGGPPRILDTTVTEPLVRSKTHVSTVRRAGEVLQMSSAFPEDCVMLGRTRRQNSAVTDRGPTAVPP